MALKYKANIDMPYLSPRGRVFYVEQHNHFLIEAKKHASKNSLDVTMPNGTVIVKDDEVIAHGANGSDYHEKYGCERVRRGIATGQSYELCEGCHPKNHSEQKAITSALAEGFDLQGAELYLWGHWWCCESCWNKMLANGIDTVYLLDGSEILFNREHPDNIIGRQFDI